MLEMPLAGVVAEVRLESARLAPPPPPGAILIGTAQAGTFLPFPSVDVSPVIPLNMRALHVLLSKGANMESLDEAKLGSSPTLKERGSSSATLAGLGAVLGGCALGDTYMLFPFFFCCIPGTGAGLRTCSLSLCAAAAPSFCGGGGLNCGLSSPWNSRLGEVGIFIGRSKDVWLCGAVPGLRGVAPVSATLLSTSSEDSERPSSVMSLSL